MNRRTLAPAAVAAALAAAVAWAATPPTEPAAVTNFGKKVPVVFDHGKHAGEGFACVQCHHNAAEGTFRCGACHTLEGEGDVLKIRDAFHGKDVGKCWSCHLAPEAGTKLKCNDCHKE